MNPLLTDLSTQLDRDLARKLYSAVSIDLERERARLRASGRPFLSPGAPLPTDPELAATARWIVERASRRRHFSTRIASVLGALSIPSEVAARSIGLLRLSQRLAIVHGFDPQSDRGQAALFRALSAGLEVELPEGPVNTRFTGLTRSSRPTVGVHVAHALIRHARSTSTSHLSRWIPVFGVVRSETDTAAVGYRMIEVYRQLADAPIPLGNAEALELPAAG